MKKSGILQHKICIHVNSEKRYFIFRPEHELNGYYVEMIGGTETQAKKSFSIIYGYDAGISKLKIEKIKSQCPLGCHAVIYPPVPEIIDDLKIENEENETEQVNTAGTWSWKDYVMWGQVQLGARNDKRKQQNISNKFYDKNIKNKLK